MNLYSENSPFKDEKWAIIGLTNGDNLFSFSSVLKRKVIVSFLASIVIGTVVVFILSKRISNPITELANKVRISSADKPMNPDKVGIIEIDELSESIENLRESVSDYSSILLQITSMADYYISAFEYKHGTNKVFITSNFFDVISGRYIAQKGNYIDLDIFKKMFNDLEKPLEEVLENESTRIYKVSFKEEPMWIKVKLDDNGKRVLGVILDITRDYAYRKEVEYERDYDLLTDLLNRRAFNKRLKEIFSNEENIKIAAMIMIDLDNLKYINDTYGHEFGDKYICSAGRVLKEISTSNILVSRMSGDEFHVFIYGFEDENYIREIIKIIIEKLNSVKIIIPGKEKINLSSSAGAAWYPKDAVTIEMLMKYADFAMYRVKHTTKGEFRDFNSNEY